jgi:hypothetical protein
MKLVNLIPLKEITKKEREAANSHFRNNLGGKVWEDSLKEIDSALSAIDDAYEFTTSMDWYDATNEYDAVSSNTYNYFLPKLAVNDVKPEKVKNSIDKLYKLYSKKLDNRYKELRKNLDTATNNLKNKIK